MCKCKYRKLINKDQNHFVNNYFPVTDHWIKNNKSLLSIHTARKEAHLSSETFSKNYPVNIGLYKI